jgi:hypothetical protein
MRAYLAELNRIKQDVEESRMVQPQSDLHVRFLAWYNGLPMVSRDRAFAMVEIEQALSTQGRYISPILLTAGWHRRRKWNSKGQYLRYWVPTQL